MANVFKKILGNTIIAAMFSIGGIAAQAESQAPAPSDENILVIEVAGEANGTIEIQLRPDLAPQHADRIKELARSGAYDGVVFHRVIDGFMAQTGDVQHGTQDAFASGRAGTGGSDLPDLPAEFSEEKYLPGVVGMARSQNPNSANSQFFIMFQEYPSLNGQYTVIGNVISGMEVVNAIKRGDSAANGSVAENPDYMSKVYIKSDM